MKDIAIEEVRKVRHEMSAECDHDITQYIAMLRKDGDRFSEQTNRYRQLKNQSSVSFVLNDKPAKPSA